jgi:hypothetical protein
VLSRAARAIRSLTGTVEERSREVALLRREKEELERKVLELERRAR